MPVTVTVPVVVPKHFTGLAVAVIATGLGSVKITEVVVTQLATSFTLKLYVPAGSEVNIPVVFVWNGVVNV